MGFLRQTAFSLGLVAGLAAVGAAAAVLLTYLFTGKLPVIQATEGERARARLLTPDELVTLFRGMAQKAEAAVDASIQVED